jgi:hypothetical protein
VFRDTPAETLSENPVNDINEVCTAAPGATFVPTIDVSLPSSCVITAFFDLRGTSMHRKSSFRRVVTAVINRYHSPMPASPVLETKGSSLISGTLERIEAGRSREHWAPSIYFSRSSRRGPLHLDLDRITGSRIQRQLKTVVVVVVATSSSRYVDHISA